MLPMIFNDDITYTNILKDHFIDSFISDFYRPEHDGQLLVVKSINDVPRGTINAPTAQYKNDEDFVFVYDIPDKYKDDYAYILSNSIEHISEEYRQKLLKFWECNEESLLHVLLYTDTKLRKVYGFDIFKELYKIVSKETEDDLE
jgi:hypothetical protein